MYQYLSSPTRNAWIKRINKDTELGWDWSVLADLASVPCRPDGETPNRTYSDLPSAIQPRSPQQQQAASNRTTKSRPAPFVYLLTGRLIASPKRSPSIASPNFSVPSESPGATAHWPLTSLPQGSISGRGNIRPQSTDRALAPDRWHPGYVLSSLERSVPEDQSQHGSKQPARSAARPARTVSDRCRPRDPGPRRTLHAGAS